MSERRKILKASGLLGALTLLSRFTGVARDAIVAHMLGATATRLADVFWFAFEIPNLARRILGEGALSSFVVPLYAERRAREGADSAWLFVNRAFNAIGLVTLAMVVAGMIFSEAAFYASGGLGMVAKARGAEAAVQAEVQAAVAQGASLTRLMLPYLIGLSLASLMMGVCHAMSVFGAPALGSTALNLTMIAAGGLAIGLGVEPNRAVRWLGWAVLVGAAIRMALMVPAMARAGWRWRPSVSFRDREVGKLFRMLGTGLFGLSINQFNIFIAGFLAGFLAVGVKAFLVNASRLVQFPMALTATALATAMLPRLTDLIVKGREDELRDVVGFAKRVEMVLMLPAILGLAAFGLPIVKLINQHGAWTEIDSIGVHETLIFFAPALLPWGWSRLVMPIYYARKDVMTPVKAAALGMIVNVILGVAFTFFTDLAHRGLALASTVSAFVVYGALSWDLRRDPARPLEGGRIGETFVKCLAAAAAAVGAGRLAYEGLIRVVDPSASKWAEAATLLPTIALVALLYFPLAHLFRTPDSDKALEMLKRRIERS